MIDTQVFDGKRFAAEIDKHTLEMRSRFESIQGRMPRLLIVVPQSSPESAVYTRSKIEKGKKLGIDTEILKAGDPGTHSNIMVDVENILLRNEIDGVFVETPLPDELDHEMIERTVPDYLDVEGVSSCMQGKNLNGRPHVIPATAEAVVRIIESLKGYYGKDVCIINRTSTVGRPLSMALLNRNYTVTICHSKTVDVKKHTLASDIIVTATGKPHLLRSEMIPEHSAIIDVGISYIDGKITGDVNVGDLQGKVGFITPVPGGVGPVTSAVIMENLLKLCMDKIENRFQE